MNTIKTILTTEAVFNDEQTKRYLLKKTWQPELPKLTICMLAPSIAAGIELDSTTSLVLNNASALGFGSVSIVNLFATLGDFLLIEAETEDPENLKAIVDAAASADVVIYAPGVGKAKLQVFQDRSRQVLEALRPFQKKLKCLTNASGKAKLLHPLCPAVRTWRILELPLEELLPTPDPKSTPKKKGRPMVVKKEASE
ncbi:MAG: DUF1643 domain-containing protein [Ruminococcaceae bacterium]|nr:DUF1643 domain-containing protein [Oscillospiraceae bacterium]